MATAYMYLGGFTVGPIVLAKQCGGEEKSRGFLKIFERWPPALIQFEVYPKPEAAWTNEAIAYQTWREI